MCRIGIGLIGDKNIQIDQNLCLHILSTSEIKCE